jgi:hypothetical protein
MATLAGTVGRGRGLTAKTYSRWELTIASYYYYSISIERMRAAIAPETVT